MKWHPRSIIVYIAEKELGAFVLDWRQRHHLTTTELVQILVGEIQLTLRFALRAERHPDAPDTPADVE